MIFRRPEANDICDIVDISTNYDTPLVKEFETAAVAIDNNKKIKAFGVVRTLLEIVLYMEGSDREKSEAIKGLLAIAIDDASKLDQDQLYAFVSDDFAQILIKHFKFRKAEGTAVVLDL